MRQLLITFSILVLLLVSFNGYSQLDTMYTFKFQLRSSIGGAFSLTPINKGYVTDELINYQDEAFYWQVLSGTIYLNERWGLEGSLFLYSAKSSQRMASGFDSEMQHFYGDDYYILYNSARENSSTDHRSFGDVKSIYAGLSYRIEKPSGFIFMPKAMLGVMSFNSNQGLLHLKEKGTNTLLEVDYRSRSSDESFSALIGPTIAYKFHHQLMVYAEVYYSYTYSNLEYVSEVKNLYTKEVSRETIEYPNHLHGLQLGIGLMLDLKY